MPIPRIPVQTSASSISYHIFNCADKDSGMNQEFKVLYGLCARLASLVVQSYTNEVKRLIVFTADDL